MYTIIRLMDESDEDVDIGWWKTNRMKLNEVIRFFNQWQIKGFDKFEAEILLAYKNRCVEYGDGNDFSEWQFDKLDFIQSVVLEHIDATRILLFYEREEDSEIEWHNANRRILNDVIKKFNMWQINGFDNGLKNELLWVMAGCQKYGESNDFADHQLELLDRMYAHVKDG